MLTLPSRWPDFTAQYLVHNLLRQAARANAYPQAAQAFTLAALDYMLHTPRFLQANVKLHPFLLGRAWRINDYVFYPLPAVTDDQVRLAGDMAKRTQCLELLVSRNAERLTRDAVRSRYPSRVIDVTSLDSFCCFKLGLNAYERGHTHTQALSVFLTHYAQLTKQTPEVSLAQESLQRHAPRFPA